MVRIRLAYGKDGLEVHLPHSAGFQGVLRGREALPLENPRTALEHALQNPIHSKALKELVKERVETLGSNATAVIVISDITRSVPHPLLLPPVLQSLEACGVRRDCITLLIGTGIHRPNEGEELIALVGREIAGNYRVVNHFCRHTADLVHCGKTSKGIPIVLNRHYCEADIKILTGFIEPHMWAGYSGGRKSLLPGIASMETMQHMHGYAMVAHPATRYGQLEDNPFHEAGLEVLDRVGADFLVNVTLDSRKQVTGWWCGHPVDAHLQGCRFLEQHCRVQLDEPLDFVLTTNAGAPLDCNLYQAVKGMTGAAGVVREGGTILIAAACPEGVGSPEYDQLMELFDSPGAFLARLQEPGFFVPDQWCAQEMAQVMLQHSVKVKCSGIEASRLRKIGLEAVDDLVEAVRFLLEKYGSDARWAVIPEGPLTIIQLSPESQTCPP